MTMLVHTGDINVDVCNMFFSPSASYSKVMKIMYAAICYLCRCIMYSMGLFSQHISLYEYSTLYTVWCNITLNPCSVQGCEYRSKEDNDCFQSQISYRDVCKIRYKQIQQRIMVKTVKVTSNVQ